MMDRTGNQRKRSRIVFMDVLRVFAFVCIILFHFMITLDLAGQFSFVQRGIDWGTPNMHMATLGVGLFFMVSGAGLMISSERKWDLKTYAKKRFLRIIIPFYIAYFLYVCFRVYTEHRLPFEPGVPAWRFIFTILGLDGYLAVVYGNGTTFSLGIGEWFLGCLLMMYVLFPILRKCMLKNKWLTLGAATMYYLLLMYFYPFQMAMHTNFCVKIYEFILGMFLALTWRQIGKKSLFVTIPVIGAFLFSPVAFPLPEGLKITIFCLAVFVSALQFEWLFVKMNWLQKILQGINSVSFEVFLIHHAVITHVSLWYAGRAFGIKEVFVAFGIVLVLITLLGILIKIIEELVMKVIKA